MNINDQHREVWKILYSTELTSVEKLIADEMPVAESQRFLNSGIPHTLLNENLVEARRDFRFQEILVNEKIHKLWGGNTIFGWWTSSFLRHGPWSLKILGSLAWLIIPLASLYLAHLFSQNIESNIWKTLAYIFFSASSLIILSLMSVFPFRLFKNYLIKRFNLTASNTSNSKNLSEFNYIFISIILTYLNPYCRLNFKNRLISNAKKLITITDGKRKPSFLENLYTKDDDVACEPKSILAAILKIHHTSGPGSAILQGSGGGFIGVNPYNFSIPFTAELNLINVIGSKYISHHQSKNLKESHIPMNFCEINHKRPEAL